MLEGRQGSVAPSEADEGGGASGSLAEALGSNSRREPWERTD